MHSASSEQDDVLGRAFDRRLAARLWAAARRHHGVVAGALALFPLIAAAELAQPYLLKVAIDDHILTADWPGLALTAGLYALTLAALYGLRMIEAYLMAVAGQRVTHDLRASLFEYGHQNISRIWFVINYQNSKPDEILWVLGFRHKLIHPSL